MTWLVNVERCNVDVKDYFGATPLMLACGSGSERVGMFLIAHRASVAERRRDGIDAIQLAAESGSVTLVRALLDAGADPNSKDYRVGWTPLHGAALNGHLEVVRLLLSAGADPAFRDYARGQSAAEVAFSFDHEKIGRLIEQAEAMPPRPVDRRKGGNSVP